MPTLSAEQTQDTTLTSTLTLPSLALCGKMGAGKTTVAELLQEHFAYHRVSVGDGIKSLAEDLYGEGNRDIWQALGSDLRKHDENVWTNQACKKIESLRTNLGAIFQPRIVVDDMRFPSEYWAFKERGFRLVEVIANRNLRVERLKANGKLTDEAQLDHPTETALDDQEAYPRDAVLTNYAGKQELFVQLVDLLKKEVVRS